MDRRAPAAAPPKRPDRADGATGPPQEEERRQAPGLRAARAALRVGSDGDAGDRSQRRHAPHRFIAQATDAGWATRRPGDPATRRPGDPATRRPGDPATRRPGDPATIIAVASSPFVNPELPIAETAAPSAAQALFTYPIMALSLLCVGATAPPKVEGRRVSHSGLPPFTTAATAREALEPRAVRPRPP